MDNEGRLLLMAVHAHPDDETISMGGTLAHYAATNAAARGESTDVIVVTGTRGELGEIVIPERDTPEEHERLGETRMGEIAAAMRALGVQRWENLGYRDSGMEGSEENADPRSFHQHVSTDLDATTEPLVRLIRSARPDVLATYDDFGGYGHPDHIAAFVAGSFHRAELRFLRGLADDAGQQVAGVKLGRGEGGLIHLAQAGQQGGVRRGGHR